MAAVVVFHLDEQGLTGGFLGVDAFFVLSGFLITTLLVLEWRRHAATHASGRGIRLGAFWGRRARRLLPALLLMMLAVALFAAIAVPTDELGRLRGDGIAGLFYVANWRFVASGQSYFDLFTNAVAVPTPLVARDRGAVLPRVAARHPRLPVARRAADCGCSPGWPSSGTVVSTVLMAVLYQADDPSRAYYGTDTHAHPILIGVLLALVLVDRAAASPRGQRVIDAAGLVALGGVSWPRSRSRTTRARACTAAAPSCSPCSSPS